MERRYYSMEPQSEDEILLDMIQMASDKGLLSPDENIVDLYMKGELSENQYVLFLSIYAHVIRQLQEEMYTLQENQDISTARGASLDNMGRLLNVQRILSQPGIMNVTVKPEIGTSSEIIIPQGTKLLMESLAGSTPIFITSNQTILPADTDSSVVLQCESSDKRYVGTLPENIVRGLEGFSNVIVISSTSSTSGRNAEDDDTYRKRLRTWAAVNTIGTRQCISSYLDSLSVVTDYRLIPRPAPEEEPGTLTIVCDTIQEECENIAREVYENCMDLTDEVPNVILPQRETVEELIVHVTPYPDVTVNNEELSKLIIAQLRIYLEGGVTRLNQTLVGIRVGADLVPSDAIRFLLEHFPEIENVYFAINDGTSTSVLNTEFSVAEDKKLKVTTISVVFE